MLSSKRDVGQKFENIAASYLRKQGCRIIEQNFLWRNGEIDLVVRDNSTIVFVEVKYRKDERFGRAAEMVNRSKQKKLIRSAQYYLQRHKKFALMDARFDVIGITHGSSQDIIVDWIKGAFTAE